jgi:6-phosphogluconolactonase (cycloisomerase 2 family)
MSLVLDYTGGVFAAKPTGGSVGTDPSTIGDANFGDVSLLLHGDGASGSTTITDSSSNAVSVTANGNAQIDTAVKKFGTGSIEFDGSGDYLSIDGTTYPLDLSGDFTIEFFVRHTNASGNQKYIDTRSASVVIADALLIDLNTNFRLFIDGSDRLLGNAGAPSVNTWYHIAVVRSGTSIKYFLNGTEELDYTQSTPKDYTLDYAWVIAVNGSTLNEHYLSGYLDELRITSAARYTSNFTPPTAAFLDTGPTLDLSSGNTFVHAPSANVAYAFSNPPASGTAIDFTLKVTGAGAYDIANASYDSVDFLTKASGTGPTGVFFKPDGTKFYITDKDSDVIRQYSLTTAWDITTASEGTTKSTSGQEGTVHAVFFKPDGTKLFIVGHNNASVFEYDLSTAWDSSTASYNSVSFNVSSQETLPNALFFNSSGTKMYMTGTNSNAVHQYGLSSAWDVSSASFTQSLSVLSEDSKPTAISFTPDGTRMVISGNQNDRVYQYSLTVGFDISTASYDNVNISISGQMTGPQGLFFKNDGTKMYALGFNNRLLRQYSTVAATPSTITWPSSVKWAGGTAPSAPASGETDAFTFYSTDGGTSYYGFQAGDAYS